jgi:hypothetical protein
MTTYEKQCKGMYLQKCSKNSNLLRTAEQFESGNWVVHVYSGLDISGEYTDKEFKKIRKPNTMSKIIKIEGAYEIIGFFVEGKLVSTTKRRVTNWK